MEHRETKICNRCQATKPIEKYVLRKGRYREHTCIACVSKAQYIRDAGKLLAQRRARRKTDPARAIYGDARKLDQKRGRFNDLTYDFIKSLISKPCSYCGESTLRMTLDRIDNEIGHVQSNVVPACIRCNYLRGNLPYVAWLCLVPGLRQARELGLYGEWTGRCR